MKNLRRARRHGAEVPTHSLNDIMFFLLLFFLIISTFINPRVIKIITAQSSNKTVQQPEKKNWDINVTVEKEVFYNGTKVNDEELEKMLRVDFAAAPDKMLVAIDFDPDLDIQKMVDILSLCKKAGVRYYMKDPRVKEVSGS
ncbi:MAG TPA: biopolymer transporter ExbD [Flavobacteriales bacterium]|nr:biopolymer transporter ExbD [Flavobacteriales bacterium]